MNTSSKIIVLNNLFSCLSSPFGNSLNVCGLDIHQDCMGIKNKDVYLVDGGINFVSKEFIENNNCYWVGDRDSIKNLSTLKMIRQEKIIYLNQDKNYSDFAKVLDICLDDPVSFYEIYNGLGGEKAHEISNILEASSFINEVEKRFKKKTTIIFHPSIILTNDKLKLNLTGESKFSIIPMGFYPRKVKIENAAYQGNFLITRASMGTSNKSSINPLVIEPEGVIMFVIEL